MLRPTPNHRRGAVAVESAIVYPVMIFLLLLLVVGGMGVFRFQQVSCLAREAARWASVRGSAYQQDTGLTSPTQAQILTQAVLPRAAGMDAAQLSVQVQWVNGVTGQVVDWDSSGKAPTTPDDSGSPVTNTVRVTVTYRWSPTINLGGTLTFKSVSEMPMSF